MGHHGPRLLILFGSETGNAQDVAERIAREALRRHFRPRMLAADAYEPPERLQQEQLVVLVAATAGQGEMASNLKRFWRFLLMKKHPGSFLQGVSYAVFGLGDSSYQHYNVAAKKLDRRLLGLGASPLLPRGLGDDQHPSGYEAALDPWLVSLWAALRLKCPLLPHLQDPAPSDPAPPLGRGKLRVTLLPPAPAAGQSPGACAPGVDIPGVAQAAEEGGRGATWVQWTRGMSSAVAMMDRALGAGGGAVRSGGAAAAAAHALPEPTQGDGSGGHTAAPAEAWGRSNPFLARLVENRRLTAEDHAQDVRHLVLDMGGSGMTYSPGDVAHVWPCQSSEAIRAFIARCGLDPRARVLVESCEEDDGQGHEGHEPASRDSFGRDLLDSNGHAQDLAVDGNGHAPANNGRVHAHDCAAARGAGARGTPGVDRGVAVFDLVAATLDVASASPRRFFFEVLSQFASSEAERERLCYFASAGGRDELFEYNQRERRTVLEVLEEFPSARVPLAWLLQACPRLRPREFSISSSPLAHPGQCHLTVAVVRHRTPLKRTRWGLCSRWLSLQPSLAQGSAQVPLWLSPGYLHLPPAPVPLILVGPGTGCAPFRSFIHERAFLAHRQAATGVRAPMTEGAPGPTGGGGPGDEEAGPVLFFFGCRHEAKDFLYREEWERLGAGPGAPLAPERGGGFFAAFSRDQERKIYVQHRVREQARWVWQLLRQGAAVFIAGSASKMPSDVMAALVDVVAEEGLLGKEDAAQWVKSLQRVGRMYVECWS